MILEKKLKTYIAIITDVNLSLLVMPYSKNPWYKRGFIIAYLVVVGCSLLFRG